jgi:predicted nucleic acid-binding Zn ribbon protein
MLKTSRLCEECGKEIFPGKKKGTRFCSSKCNIRNWHSRNPHKSRAYSRVCEWCGGNMSIEKNAKSRFCSERCRQRSWDFRNPDKEKVYWSTSNTSRSKALRIQRIGRRCEVCGVEISSEKKVGTRFCSNKCCQRARTRKLVRLCEWCGGKIPMEIIVTALICSDRCKRERRRMTSCIRDHMRIGIIITPEEYLAVVDTPFCQICKRRWDDIDWNHRLGYGSRRVFEL